ncbi:hypothetical protein THRCLA_20714 [Thraustotheca clavata]|uniref:Uncharacterized protein n=1 Tax=Thraustotheca clavata TaxID=74557 RepID=A0A1W0A4H2_9STRA|nr:hypothetical protein THRCLA_20714 [Thraustotheca clavata]
MYCLLWKTLNHKVKPLSTPKGNWKKNDLFNACMKFGLYDVNINDLKATMWPRLKMYVATNIVPVVVDMARERGHDVIYTPPNYYHIWAIVKGRVGCAYTAETTFEQVYERLETAFWNLDAVCAFLFLFAVNQKIRASDDADEPASDHVEDDVVSSSNKDEESNTDE